MKNNFSKIFLVVFIIIAFVTVGVFLINKDNVRVGFETDEEVVLQNGTYSVEELKLNGTYAVVAIAGNGDVSQLTGESKELSKETFNDELYKDIQKRAPKHMENHIIYEEGTKVNIEKSVKSIRVQGDDLFKIKLIKR
ncbi:hypothetical protein FJQ98_24435 [Lysinibacillus agricola]|uniref:Uncharacterized protein n=1 Tax=Lysinibacillus agricola TaxID=2590012 RepID=A0ABX7ARG1_9BACI|nr:MULTISPECIES: hypothetical protein [Lysinibacillus]KOS63226.1 hypothetical protein AN161_08375 [Lysinibacillus sp. FJAT-14222]QQP12206.1 hypothetical protein FJQ98_24435 [Lysinibacillus agricola]